MIITSCSFLVRHNYKFSPKPLHFEFLPKQKRMEEGTDRSGGHKSCEIGRGFSLGNIVTLELFSVGFLQTHVRAVEKADLSITQYQM